MLKFATGIHILLHWNFILQASLSNLCLNMSKIENKMLCINWLSGLALPLNCNLYSCQMQNQNNNSRESQRVEVLIFSGPHTFKSAKACETGSLEFEYAKEHTEPLKARTPTTSFSLHALQDSN